jgi:hypothetical protein
MKGRISEKLERILRSPQGSVQLRRVLTNQTNEPVQVGGVRFFIRKVGQVGSMSLGTSKSSSSVEMT